MKKIFVLGILCASLTACDKPAENPVTAEETETHDANHHHEMDEEAEPIALNNGEKWVVNEEMKPFVQKGEDLVGVYIRENQTDYQNLAKQLTEQNSQLIESCTMEGKSHDELHNWLHPHLELVKELQDSDDAKEANEVVHQLQNSYREYHQYFQ